MFKTILVPVALEQAERTLPSIELARDLAAAHGAKLVLLHVLEPLAAYVEAEVPTGFRHALRS